MPRFSHDDPRYTAALHEMGQRLSKMLDARDWTAADLVRAARLHMPPDPATGRPGRLNADNVSNIKNGKRRPTRAFVKAITAALGCAEEDLLPPFLMDGRPAGSALPPLLAAVPGRPDVYRVFIDRELPLPQALKIIAALEEGNAHAA
jgi:transcriptional regulator with XRE-family HTH domain